MADTIRQHIKRLENIKGEIEKIVGGAALAGAKPIVDRAKEIVLQEAYDSGDLYRSIDAHLGEVTREHAVALIGSDEPYAKYVEAHLDGGFLARAREERLAEANAVAGRALDEAIKSGAK